MCRLGIGYNEETCQPLSSKEPVLIEEGIEDSHIVSAACGRNMNFIAVKSGVTYSWGKGDHDKPKFEDYEMYSVPFPLLTERNIVHVSCGMSHVMVLDSDGKLYGWGDGKNGCLGFGD